MPMFKMERETYNNGGDGNWSVALSLEKRSCRRDVEWVGVISHDGEREREGGGFA